MAEFKDVRDIDGLVVTLEEIDEVAVDEGCDEADMEIVSVAVPVGEGDVVVESDVTAVVVANTEFDAVPVVVTEIVRVAWEDIEAEEVLEIEAVTVELGEAERVGKPVAEVVTVIVFPEVTVLKDEVVAKALKLGLTDGDDDTETVRKAVAVSVTEPDVEGDPFEETVVTMVAVLEMVTVAVSQDDGLVEGDVDAALVGVVLTEMTAVSDTVLVGVVLTEMTAVPDTHAEDETEDDITVVLVSVLIADLDGVPLVDIDSLVVLEEDML